MILSSEKSKKIVSKRNVTLNKLNNIKRVAKVVLKTCHKLWPYGHVAKCSHDFVERLVFSRFFDLRRNLRNVKEKPNRKKRGKKRLTRLTLLGGTSLMPTKFLLYFHEKYS